MMKPLSIPELIEYSQLVSASSDSVCVYTNINKLYCWNLFNDIMIVETKSILDLQLYKNKICYIIK